jgi:hypothetical protein
MLLSLMYVVIRMLLRLPVWTVTLRATSSPREKLVVTLPSPPKLWSRVPSIWYRTRANLPLSPVLPTATILPSVCSAISHDSSKADHRESKSVVTLPHCSEGRIQGTRLCRSRRVQEDETKAGKECCRSHLLLVSATMMPFRVSVALCSGHPSHNLAARMVSRWLEPWEIRLGARMERFWASKPEPMMRSLSAPIEVGLQEAGHSRCEAVGAHVECARAGVEALGSAAIGVEREVI